MKFCPNCGHELDDDSIFCENCGNSVPVNLKDKSNINKFGNKSISDIINPILERPKLLLLIIIILIILIGVMAIFNSNSDSNTFGGQKITLNGVDFNIPEGFESNQLVSSNPKTDADFVLRSADGKRALAYIHIWVSDNIAPSSYLAQHLSNGNKVTINGKECIVERSSGNTVFCAYYYSNDKAVQLNVPYSYEYNNKVYSYQDTLAEMIK